MAKHARSIPLSRIVEVAPIPDGGLSEIPPSTRHVESMRRSRRAYERRRALRAAKATSPVLVLLAAHVVASPSARVMIPTAAIVVVWFGLRWRGRGWDRGLGVAGGFGFAIVAVSELARELACSLGCSACLGPVVLGCAVACNAISVVGGIAIALRASRDRDSLRLAVGALAILALAGLLACGTLGVVGGIGGVIGGALTVVATFCVARRC